MQHFATLPFPHFASFFNAPRQNPHSSLSGQHFSHQASSAFSTPTLAESTTTPTVLNFEYLVHRETVFRVSDPSYPSHSFPIAEARLLQLSKSTVSLTTCVESEYPPYTRNASFCPGHLRWLDAGWKHLCRRRASGAQAALQAGPGLAFEGCIRQSPVNRVQ